MVVFINGQVNFVCPTCPCVWVFARFVLFCYNLHQSSTFYLICYLSFQCYYYYSHCSNTDRYISGDELEATNPGLVDRVLALHAGSRGFDSHRGHMSERFFRSNRPGYPHPVSSELEISGIRVAVGDCSVTERRRWRPPYQTGKTACARKHYKHNEDGRTAPGVCGNGSVPLSHSGNVVTRIGIHTHTHTHTQATNPKDMFDQFCRQNISIVRGL